MVFVVIICSVHEACLCGGRDHSPDLSWLTITEFRRAHRSDLKVSGFRVRICARNRGRRVGLCPPYLRTVKTALGRRWCRSCTPRAGIAGYRAHRVGARHVLADEAPAGEPWPAPTTCSASAGPAAGTWCSASWCWRRSSIRPASWTARGCWRRLGWRRRHTRRSSGACRPTPRHHGSEAVRGLCRARGSGTRQQGRELRRREDPGQAEPVHSAVRRMTGCSELSVWLTRQPLSSPSRGRERASATLLASVRQSRLPGLVIGISGWAVNRTDRFPG